MTKPLLLGRLFAFGGIDMPVRINDGITLQGSVEVEIRNKTGNPVAHWTDRNLTVISGSNLVRDLLAGTPGISGLSHFAIGIDSSQTTPNTIKLGNEVFRGPITKFERGARFLKAYFFLAATEANGNLIREAGLFGGDATASTDSGTLYARTALTQTVNKTSDISVTFIWTLAFEAVST